MAHGTESFMGTLANSAQAKFPNFSAKLFNSQHLGIILCLMSALNLKATELEKTNHISFQVLALWVSLVPVLLRRMLSLGPGDTQGEKC